MSPCLPLTRNLSIGEAGDNGPGLPPLRSVLLLDVAYPLAVASAADALNPSIEIL